jgi:hypothetical protein
LSRTKQNGSPSPPKKKESFSKKERKEITVSPQGTDFVLATNVPYRETDVLVLDRLDIEAFVGFSMNDMAPSHFPSVQKQKKLKKKIPMVGMVVTISPSLSL